MGRGPINSTSRSSASDGHARPPQVAASTPMLAADRATETKDGRSRREVVPLRDRCWVSVNEAIQVTGEGRTKIYELIALGKLLTKKTGRRRLINVRSLLEYCGE
jgi:excisionase family DNA binding protein